MSPVPGACGYPAHRKYPASHDGFVPGGLRGYHPGIVQRRTYTFSGNVQGVGFRYTAQHLARNHPVAGYVRNLPDGRVELVAEGDEKALDALAQAIARQMEGFIRETNVESAPATGQFSGFAIRH